VIGTEHGMSFDLLNPWMLAGLAGISLPVLAHLLSKKKYDVVRWGAMQFLQLGQETRRRVWLEDLWLLLLRMALIAWLVIGLARPWVSAKWLGDIGPQPNRDVVLILDGSYSMAWEGTSVTPQERSVRWIDRFLQQLRPGDTLALLEAREQVRPLIDPPTRDVNRVRDALQNLSPPTGTANFPEALAYAIKLLSRTNHLRREVVLLTDGQQQGWFPEDTNLWLRVDDLAKQSSVAPHLWVVNVLDQADTAAEGPPPERLNFHVERLQVSRELSVPGFPIRFQTRVRYSGGSSSVTRQVHFEVDGQRLAERTISVSLSPGGEANVEFEHRFEAIGSHLVRVALDADDLPTDNFSEAVVVIADAVSVLIVDGDPRPDPVQSETFFLRAALAASGNDTPWIKPTLVNWSDWTPQPPAPPISDAPSSAARDVTLMANPLNRYSAILLANVPQLSATQLAALTDFAQRGGGIGIALGSRVDRDRYQEGPFSPVNGWLPVLLSEIESATPEQREEGLFIANASLEAPWLKRFRAEQGAALTSARFSRWWKVDFPKPALPDQPALDESKLIDPSLKPVPQQAVVEPDSAPKPQIERRPPVVLARLQTGAPYLVAGQFGRGNILLLTAPLDADWNTLPTKPDYVAFVHELLFQLAARRGDRNVAVGEPLIVQPPTRTDAAKPEASAEFLFEGPDGLLHEPQVRGDESTPLLVLNDTPLPGVYSLRRKLPGDDERLANRSKSAAVSRAKPAPSNPPLAIKDRELFAVNADRAESNLTPLSDNEKTKIAGENRLQWIREGREIQLAASSELPRHELWQLLFLAFLALLIGEVLLTRKLVRGGHVANAD
jgi:hypothetical protein